MFEDEIKVKAEQWPQEENEWVLDESNQETFLPNLSGSISTESLRTSAVSRETKSRTCRNCLFWKKTPMNEFEGDCTADSTVAVTLDRTDACFTCDSFESND